MPGQKGWRSPIPEWWVEHANDLLKRRNLEKKAFAASLPDISEEKVLRALHGEPSKRVATLETIEAISDALGLPRPVVVAASYGQALELQAIVSFDAADAERSRIAAEVEHERGLRTRARSGGDGSDGRTTERGKEVDERRARTGSGRPATVPRTPRAR